MGRQGHFCRAASSRPLPASGGPFSGPATSFAFPPQSSSAAMLSRALLRAGLARNALSQVRPVSTTSAKAGSIPAWVDGVDIFENEKNPERDHVNFPRRKRGISLTGQALVDPRGVFLILCPQDRRDWWIHLRLELRLLPLLQGVHH